MSRSIVHHIIVIQKRFTRYQKISNSERRHEHYRTWSRPSAKEEGDGHVWTVPESHPSTRHALATAWGCNSRWWVLLPHICILCSQNLCRFWIRGSNDWAHIRVFCISSVPHKSLTRVGGCLQLVEQLDWSNGTCRIGMCKSCMRNNHFHLSQKCLRSWNGSRPSFRY